MSRRFVVAGILACVSVTVLAQGDVIAERRQIMKGVAAATGNAVKMLKGDAPFDLAKVQSTLKVYVDAAGKMPLLFPDTAQTGGGTHALPKIWSDKPDFVGRFDKFGKEAAAAMTAIKNEASFKATFPQVLKNCGECHEPYRAPLG